MEKPPVDDDAADDDAGSEFPAFDVTDTHAAQLKAQQEAQGAAMRGETGRLFADDVTRGIEPSWTTRGERSAVCEIGLRRPESVAIVDLREDITRGQAVSRYVVEGATDAKATTWRELSRGTTVGYRKLDRFAPTVIHAIRLSIEAIASPARLEVRAYRAV